MLNKQNFKSLIVFLMLFSTVVLFVLPFSIVHAEAGVTTLDNPLPSADPRAIIGNVIKAVLGLVGSLALLMFIYGGFLWVVSGGSEEKISQGKKIIVWTTTGLALIFFSYMLVSFIVGTLTTNQPAGDDAQPLQQEADAQSLE